jgi:NADH-quinone oxidoreductase subunit J
MSHAIVLAGSAADNTRQVAFWVLAILSVAAGIGMVVARRAVHCAVLLAVVMLSLAVLYAMLGAPFLAFVQVIVYTGAVLMLFLFVMMIVGISSSDSIIETIRGQRLWAALAGIGLLVLLSLTVGHAVIGPAAPPRPGFGPSNISSVATLIFTRYVYPFEVTSALLITAALGAMVLAHRERTSPKPTQRELARRRLASGRPTPLPGPGTYARHNAVDMPALLPDGSTSRLSVSRAISRRGENGASVPAAAVATGRPLSRGLEAGVAERPGTGRADGGTVPAGTPPGGAGPGSTGPGSAHPDGEDSGGGANGQPGEA